jgi:hypothetical protein
MGMQQTYGGVARIIAPLFFGWSFDTLGVSSPYFFSSAFIVATIFLGFGLDKYAKHEEPRPQITPLAQEAAQPADVTTAVSESANPQLLQAQPGPRSPSN